MDEELIELTTEENIDVNTEEVVESEINAEDLEQSVETEETLQTVEVETVEEIEIEVEEAIGWVGGDSTRHYSLAGRDEADQHPIGAITGLRAELDNIEKLQIVYSDKKQQADYYLWRQDEEHPLPANPYGLFVSILQNTDKIQICDGTNDVFGVTVEEAAFVGNQEYAQADGGSKIGRDGKYCLVMHSGLVGVRCETTVTVGDYVVPNVRGEAKKSDGDYGYLVTALSEINGENYAIISLVAPSTLAETLANNVQNLSGRMRIAESRIASVTNVANDAYVTAKDAKELSEEDIKLIEEKVSDALKQVENNDKAVKQLNTSVQDVLADVELTKAIAQSAVSESAALRNEAVSTANDAIAGIIDIAKGIQPLVYKITAYNVGEYSQAYGLTLEQSVAALSVGIVYIPTTVHKEVYYSTETQESFTQEFLRGYCYTWNGQSWLVSESVSVNFSNTYIEGTAQTPYWVVTDADVINDGVTYVTGRLYKWENGAWVNTGASVEENSLNRSVNYIHQTVNETSFEVTNAKGDFASLGARLDSAGAQVSMVASVVTNMEGIKPSGICDTVSDLPSIAENGAYYCVGHQPPYDVYKWNDESGAFEQQLLIYYDGVNFCKINTASIIGAVNNEGKGSMSLNAEKINFVSQEFAIWPIDKETGEIDNSDKPNFAVNEYGDVSINGTVYATAGEIGGYTIGDTDLQSKDKTVGMSSDTTEDAYSFWAGNATKADAPFRVKPTGELYATAGEIGGCKIDGDLLIGGVIQSKEYQGDVSGLKIDLNNSTFDSPHFKVNSDGTIYADKGEIGGYSINATYLQSKDGSVGMSSDTTEGTYSFWAGNSDTSQAPFSVTNDGFLNATDAKIKGDITVDNLTLNIDATIGGSLRSSNYSQSEGEWETLTNIEINSGFVYSDVETTTSKNILGTTYSMSCTVIGVLQLNRPIWPFWCQLSINDIITRDSRASYSDLTLVDYWVEDGIKIMFQFTLTMSNTISQNYNSIESVYVTAEFAYASCSSGMMINFGDSPLIMSPNFLVDAGGVLTAKNANIEGTIIAAGGEIGGFIINDNTLRAGNIGISSNGVEGTYTFWAGNEDPSLADFSVSNGGFLTAKSGKIGGWGLYNGSLIHYDDNLNFVKLSTSGVFYQKNSESSGKFMSWENIANLGQEWSDPDIGDFT